MEQQLHLLASTMPTSVLKYELHIRNDIISCLFIMQINTYESLIFYVWLCQGNTTEVCL